VDASVATETPHGAAAKVIGEVRVKAVEDVDGTPAAVR
jgi:hypothetical protein